MNQTPRDSRAQLPVSSTESRFTGRVWSVRTDVVEFEHVSAVRDVIVHPGAVAVVAVDDDERLLLIEQYRHPVQARLLELPAGLLDVAGEAPLATAQRELAEEAGFTAQRWNHLVDLFLSPGGSTEALRVFLARGLAPLPGGRLLTGEAEEADLPQRWIGIDEAVDAVMQGRFHNVTTVAGVLALAEVARRGWAGLGSADLPWPPISEDRPIA